MPHFEPGRTYTQREYRRIRGTVEALDIPPNPNRIRRGPAYAFKVLTTDVDARGVVTVRDLVGWDDPKRRIIGGFVVRDGKKRRDFLDAELRRQGLSLNNRLKVGDVLRLRWDHLRTWKTTGTATYGNFVGPGSGAWWFTRPVDLFDLAAKLHDFAYELNGLRVRLNARRPAAFWSRKAKADMIFKGLTDPIRDGFGLGGRFQRWVAGLIFALNNRLYLQGDHFINPLRYTPQDWLLLPYKSLQNVPDRFRVRYQRRDPSSGRRRSYLRHYHSYEVPVLGEDTTDAWKPPVRKLIGSYVFARLERINGETGHKAVRRESWIDAVPHPAKRAP